jgi:hypothetical protein
MPEISLGVPIAKIVASNIRKEIGIFTETWALLCVKFG